MRQEYLFRQVLYLIPTRKDLSKYKDQGDQFVISEFNPREEESSVTKAAQFAKKLEQQKELFARIKIR